MDAKHVFWLGNETKAAGACVWRYAPWATEKGCKGSSRPDTLWRSSPPAEEVPVGKGGWCVIPTYEQGACDRFEYATWDADIARCVWNLELWRNKDACVAAAETRPDTQWYTD
jgi:hypothetical protein